MFFSRFENINYDGRVQKDLSTALIIKPKIKESKDLFFWYTMEEWEKPETIAFDHYGNTKYNFIILLMNDIVDPFFDWPLERHELLAKCEGLYGIPSQTSGIYDKVTDLDVDGNPVAPFRNAGYFAVRYYLKDGIEYYDPPGSGLYSEAPLGSLAVSHLEYEEQLNDAKRKIKILHRELIPQMDKELDIIFNGK